MTELLLFVHRVFQIFHEPAERDIQRLGKCKPSAEAAQPVAEFEVNYPGAAEAGSFSKRLVGQPQFRTAS